jgi:hypothetical protein
MNRCRRCRTAGDDDPLALSLCQFLVKYYGWKADRGGGL